MLCIRFDRTSIGKIYGGACYEQQISIVLILIDDGLLTFA